MGKEKTNKHKEFWRDTPWRACVPSVPWTCPICPVLCPICPAEFCSLNWNFHINRPKRRGCPWDVPNLSLGRFRGIPTTKFLYVIFLYRFSPYFSENSRRLWLFLRSARGFPRKIPGKSQENCWKMFPESRHALNSRISGTGKGKPAANLRSTLPGTLSRPSVRGAFWNRQLQPSRVLLNFKQATPQWPDQNNPPCRKTGAAIPMLHCVSCGIAATLPLLSLKIAYRSPKTGLTRGVSQKKLASEAYRAIGGVARNSIANRAKSNPPSIHLM